MHVLRNSVIYFYALKITPIKIVTMQNIEITVVKFT
jgi:hypothetical protein